MKIQIWRRKNKEKEKYNLYIRYRLSQIKAKVESLKLWEWISAKNISQKNHNLNVKRAYEEILRRRKDDLENNRSKIDFKSKQPDEFEFIFKKYSKIKNYNAVFNFLKKIDYNIEKKKINSINKTYLNQLKSKIENKIKNNDIKGTTSAKYWNNFKSVLIHLNDNGICDYPRVGGITYKKENSKIYTFNSEEIKKLRKTTPEKWKDLKKAFFFSYNTGLKIGKIVKLKWKNLYKTNNDKKTIHYFKIKNNNETLTNSLPKNIRKMIGKRKPNNELVFTLPEKQSNRSKIFKEWLNKLNINKKKKFNDAVNNYAKNLYDKTKNIYKVAAALGHNSINKTKEIYNYMENYDFLENENIIIKNLEENINQTKSKSLFKKGNLLSYRIKKNQDT
jgi:integrase